MDDKIVFHLSIINNSWLQLNYSWMSCFSISIILENKDNYIIKNIPMTKGSIKNKVWDTRITFNINVIRDNDPDIYVYLVMDMGNDSTCLCNNILLLKQMRLSLLSLISINEIVFPMIHLTNGIISKMEELKHEAETTENKQIESELNEILEQTLNISHNDDTKEENKPLNSTIVVPIPCGINNNDKLWMSFGSLVIKHVTYNKFNADTEINGYLLNGDKINISYAHKSSQVNKVNIKIWCFNINIKPQYSFGSSILHRITNSLKLSIWNEYNDLFGKKLNDNNDGKSKVFIEKSQVLNQQFLIKLKTMQAKWNTINNDITSDILKSYNEFNERKNSIFI